MGRRMKTHACWENSGIRYKVLLLGQKYKTSAADKYKEFGEISWFKLD